MANPDQTVHEEQSDSGLHSLYRPQYVGFFTMFTSCKSFTITTRILTCKYMVDLSLGCSSVILSP